jgi:PAS domain S-box-containing protein
MILDTDILQARILVVDDKIANVRLLEQMLAGAGYSSVDSTMDPTQVTALHREHRYDLILLDLQMPGMDGFEVLDALKALEAGSYLPVLAITAQPGHELRALQAGARDFVSKPFELLQIKTRIHNLLEVRLLYRALADHNLRLERTVQARTAELRASEERFQRLTELSSDWYWEQDANGVFTQVSGPALEMLGVRAETDTGWNESERSVLNGHIAARRPFLDFVYSRVDADGAKQYFQVSGEPMFDPLGRYSGYRGVGMDVTARMRVTAPPN